MEVNALKSHYRLIAAGDSYDASKQDFEFVSLIKGFLTFHYKYPVILRVPFSFLFKLYFKLPFARRTHSNKKTVKYNYKILKEKQFDLIIVHHLWDLPLVVKLARLKDVKIIFNAHEYYPLECDDNERWMKKEHPILMQIANKYFKDIDVCFCVGKIIADKYKEEFDLISIVITNAKPFYNLTQTLLKKGERIKLVHHGVALRMRNIELMIEMMNYLDDGYSLDLVLVGDEYGYLKELKALARKNINFVKPVSTTEISNFINKYDIGVYILPNNNFNNTYALPNKFFEFVQARLAIAIAPSPEMAELVHKYDLGIVSDDFTPQSLAKKIKELSAEKIMYYKNQSHKHAMDLSVEKTELLIKQTVDNLLTKN